MELHLFTLWAVIAVAGALVMRAGFVIQHAGLVRSKNSSAMVARHLADFCIAILGYWAIGMALEQSGGRFIWIEPKLLIGWDSNASGMGFMGVSGVLIATAILPGVLAERARFWAGIWPALLMAAIVIPIVRAWTTSTGFLGSMGFFDSIGASTLHFPAALAAAVGAIFVGPRTGKFNRDGSSTAIPGHSVPLAGAGLFVLIFGWILFGAFSIGSPAATIRNLLLAAAAGGLASLILSQVRYYKPDIHLISAGVLGALVAASAGGGALGSLGAVLTGGVAGLIVPLSILILDVTFRLDDPTGGVSIHGVAAVWGAISAPFMVHGTDACSTMGGRFKCLGVNVLGLAIIAVFTVALSVGLWLLLKQMTKLRVPEHDEFDGLDLAEHDIGSYPDFQQNTIKSYHLREV